MLEEHIFYIFIHYRGRCWKVLPLKSIYNQNFGFIEYNCDLQTAEMFKLEKTFKMT